MVTQMKPFQLDMTAFNKNLIINGDMRIDQRQAGNALSISGGNAKVIDRWRCAMWGSGTISAQQVSDAPSSSYFDKSLKITATTGNGSPAAGDEANFQQPVEGYIYRRIKGKTATLSFWVKASKTGTMCVSFLNDAATYSYVTDVTINAANTWEKKTVTLTFNSAGTWDTTNGRGLIVMFTIMCGSTYQTSTTDSWVSGSYYASTNISNFVQTTNDTIQITGVQLEEGVNSTDFEFRDFGTEMLLCQRYFIKSFQYSVVPANITGTSGAIYAIANANGQLTSRAQFPVTMRATPTLTFYPTNSSSGGHWSTNNSQNPSVGIGAQGERGFGIYGNTASYYGHYVHWTADAEL